MRETVRPYSKRLELRPAVSLLAGAAALWLLFAPASVTAQTPASETAIADAEAAAPAVVEPDNRYDLGAWLEYQHQTGSAALPEAARLFHRRGLALLGSGAQEDGVRMLRGATQLDPGFLAPHVALVRHFLARDASQALRELARIVDLARTHYGLQHHLVTSALFFLVLSILLATATLSVYAVWRHRGVILHTYQDLLERRFPTMTAKAGAWAFLSLPYLLGFGVLYPTVFLLGTMWGGLKKTERALFLFFVLSLAALPFVATRYAAFAVPDVAGEAPFYGTVELAHAPYDAETLAELQKTATEHPGNPILLFSIAWLAQRGGNYELAEQMWTETRDYWPMEPRIPNNLGNLALLQDRQDEAERFYEEASALDPDWAVPHYNLGQLYTRQFRYAEASEQLARASSSDFELVRNLQSGGATRSGDPLPLAWGWIEPTAQWEALSLDPARQRGIALPTAWLQWRELNGWSAASLALVAAALGLFLGAMSRQRLPVRQCSNCRREVCRRCATAFRERIYCASCTGAQGEAAAPEFARLLLLRQRRAADEVRRRGELLFSAILPAYGPVAVGHQWISWCLLAIAFPWFLSGLGLHPPYAYDARIGPLAPHGWDGGSIIAFLIVQALSLAMYFSLRSGATEEEESAQSRRSSTRLPRAA